MSMVVVPAARHSILQYSISHCWVQTPRVLLHCHAAPGCNTCNMYGLGDQVAKFCFTLLSHRMRFVCHAKESPSAVGRLSGSGAGGRRPGVANRQPAASPRLVLLPVLAEAARACRCGWLHASRPPAAVASLQDECHDATHQACRRGLLTKYSTRKCVQLAVTVRIQHILTMPG